MKRIIIGICCSFLLIVVVVGGYLHLSPFFIKQKILLCRGRMVSIINAIAIYWTDFSQEPLPDWLFANDTLFREFYLITEGEKEPDKIGEFKRWASSMKFSGLKEYLMKDHKIKRHTVEKMFSDPFNTQLRYGMCDINKDYWGKKFILSNGPDKDIDIDETKFLTLDKDSFVKAIIYNVYDPTNGLISNGDMFHSLWIEDIKVRYPDSKFTRFMGDLKYWIWINLGINLRE